MAHHCSGYSWALLALTLSLLLSTAACSTEQDTPGDILSTPCSAVPLLRPHQRCPPSHPLDR